MSNTTSATCGTGSAYSSRAPEITTSFSWGSCCLVFSFLCCVLCTIWLSVFLLFSRGVVSLFSIYEFDLSLWYLSPLFCLFTQHIYLNTQYFHHILFDDCIICNQSKHNNVNNKIRAKSVCRTSIRRMRSKLYEIQPIRLNFLSDKFL